MFKPKHQHEWTVIGLDFQEPPRTSEVSRVSPETIQMLMFGATTLTQRCLECGWVETSLVPGKAVVPHMQTPTPTTR